MAKALIISFIIFVAAMAQIIAIYIVFKKIRKKQAVEEEQTKTESAEEKS